MSSRHNSPNELSTIIARMTELNRMMSQSQGLRNLQYIIAELNRVVNQSEGFRTLLYTTAELNRAVNRSEGFRNMLDTADQLGSRLRQLNELAEASAFSPAFARYLTHTYVDFSQAFSDLQRSAGAPHLQDQRLNHIVVSSSHIEHANETHLVGTLVEVPSESEVVEEQETPSIVPITVEGATIEDLLNDLDPRLVDLWYGALDARDSDNIDRVRHFSSSLRELFTHVVHAIAPDHEINQWSDDPSYYHNGRPTRRARMLFVVRNVNDESLSTFFERDVSACLKLLDILQGGVQSVESPYKPSQVAAIEMRFEGMLRFLLQMRSLE